MKEKKPKLYEGMYILSAHLSPDAQNKGFEKIKAGITNRGGTICKIHDQGKRRLAYDIGHHSEGHYYLVYFELTPDSVTDFQNELRINEDLVRYMHMKTEKVLEELKFKQLPEQ